MKKFHISDILSITTGMLVSSRHIEGVYDILNFMSGQSLFTHQLPRVCDESAPVLERLYPQLAAAALAPEIADLKSRLSKKGANADVVVTAWVAGIAARVGEEFDVPRLSDAQHERIDPMSELAEMVHPDRIVVI